MINTSNHERLFLHVDIYDHLLDDSKKIMQRQSLFYFYKNIGKQFKICNSTSKQVMDKVDNYKHFVSYNVNIFSKMYRKGFVTYVFFRLMKVTIVQIDYLFLSEFCSYLSNVIFVNSVISL